MRGGGSRCYSRYSGGCRGGGQLLLLLGNEGFKGGFVALGLGAQAIGFFRKSFFQRFVDDFSVQAIAHFAVGLGARRLALF